MYLGEGLLICDGEAMVIPEATNISRKSWEGSVAQFHMPWFNTPRFSAQHLNFLATSAAELAYGAKEIPRTASGYSPDWMLYFEDSGLIRPSNAGTGIMLGKICRCYL
jgi:hypothetical protein